MKSVLTCPGRLCTALAVVGAIVFARVASLSGSGVASSEQPAITDVSAFGPVDSLDVCVDGNTIHLLIGRNGEGEQPAKFSHTRSDDGGRTWRPPVRVNAAATTHAPVPHHRGADAKLVARDDKLFAVWTTTGTGFKGTGPMGTALSADGGKTWQPGPNPADHASTGSHRFMALTDDGKAFHLLWLDDRDEKRGLRHASSTDGGKTWSRNHTLDELTCACCWNEIIHIPPAPGVNKDDRGTLLALYRDIEPSDMGLCISRDGGETWKNMGHVGEFDWVFKGCPHVGGGIAALPPPERADAKTEAKTIFSAVWTGLPESAGCHLLRSDDAGKLWLPIMRFGDATARHPAIACDAKGNVALLWDEAADGDRAVMSRVSKDGGKTWSATQRLSAKGTSATHACVVAKPAGDGFFVLWTQLKDGAYVPASASL